MKNLRTRFERFCYRNRDKGIPNLMLYITIGAAIVYMMMLFNGGNILYSYLSFDKTKILQGQIWRLFTYVFTYAPGSGLLTPLFLFFFYMLGRHVEQSMGTFRFNLYYFCGVILMDVFAMIFCPTSNVIIGGYLATPSDFNYLVYANMAYYLHLSLLLTFATVHPNSQFLIMFIIPIKAWVMGIVYLVLMAAEVFNLTFPLNLFPHNLFPLVGMLNYLLFAGKDVLNLFPFLQKRPHRNRRQSNPIPFRQSPSQPSNHAPSYSHRCTVCGRTDVSNPELEFRYCSRCNGYYCYCEDHISNHTHIE